MILYDFKPSHKPNMNNEICIILKKDNMLYFQLSNGETESKYSNNVNLDQMIKSNNYLAISDSCILNLKNIRSIKKIKTFCLIITIANVKIRLSEKYHSVLLKIVDGSKVQGPGMY